MTFGEFAGREGDIVSGDRAAPREPGRARRRAGQPRQGRGVRCRRPSRCLARPTSTATGSRRYVVGVVKGFRGPQVTLSRTHPNLVRKLFALEVPEIADGIVEIAAVAREAGHRSKIAVRATRSGVNAKGACIGPMGSAGAQRHDRAATARRSTSSTTSEDPATFVGNALSPGRGHHRSRSSTWPPARPGSSCPTTSCRWRSARRGRTPGWPPGSPAGGSTSAATPPRATPPPPAPQARARSRRRPDRPTGRPGRGGAAGPRVRSPPPGWTGPIGAGRRGALDCRGSGRARRFPVRTCVGCRCGCGLRAAACRRGRRRSRSPIRAGGCPAGVLPCTTTGVSRPRGAAPGVRPRTAPGTTARPGHDCGSTSHTVTALHRAPAHRAPVAGVDAAGHGSSSQTRSSRSPAADSTSDDPRHSAMSRSTRMSQQ